MADRFQIIHFSFFLYSTPHRRDESFSDLRLDNHLRASSFWSSILFNWWTRTLYSTRFARTLENILAHRWTQHGNPVLHPCVLFTRFFRFGRTKTGCQSKFKHALERAFLRTSSYFLHLRRILTLKKFFLKWHEMNSGFDFPPSSLKRHSDHRGIPAARIVVVYPGRINRKLILYSTVCGPALRFPFFIDSIVTLPEGGAWRAVGWQLVLSEYHVENLSVTEMSNCSWPSNVRISRKLWATKKLEMFRAKLLSSKIVQAGSPRQLGPFQA